MFYITCMIFIMAVSICCWSQRESVVGIDVTARVCDQI